MSGQILIVDDHEVVRREIRTLLSSRPGWKICGEAVDGLDAIEKAKALALCHPDGYFHASNERHRGVPHYSK